MHRLKRKWTVLFLLKALFTEILVFYSIVELILQTRNPEEINLSNLFCPICLFTAAVSSLILLFCEKMLLASSSPPQFMFYLLLAIGTATTFRVQIEELMAQDEKTWMEITQAFTLFPITVILLFLNCFADLDCPLAKDDPLEGNCSFPSSLFYAWLDQFILEGYHNTITLDNLLTPPKSLHVERSAQEFFALWCSISKKQGTASIWPVLFRQYGAWYLQACILVAFKCMLIFGGPEVLKLLVNHMDSDEASWKGFLYVAVLFASQLLCTVCWARALHELNNMSLQMRSNVLSLIYRKALRLSNRSRKKYSVGEVMNYMAVDAQRIVTIFPQSHSIWSSPLQVLKEDPT